jgi:hypothetical protein
MNYRQRRRFLWTLFLIGLFLIAVVASATTLARLKFGDLAEQATAIARVRCLSSQSVWKNGEIWTRTRAEVLELSKGDLSNIVEIEMPGGVIGHLHAHVDSVPVFRPGDEAYLFLWAQPGQPFRVLGWTQGTFRIKHDLRTGAESVTQDSAASLIFDPLTRQFRSAGVRNMPIAAFQLKLRRALEKSSP